MSDDVILVTGAMGCVGSWIIRQLLDEDTAVVAYDQATDRKRLRLLASESELERVTFETGDIRDAAAVTDLVRRRGITHIVHLAALTVIPCRERPVLGAEVDVIGHINVLQAAADSQGQVRGIAYASTVAVFGPAERYPGGVATDESPADPATLYGVHKHANEATAKVYARDHGVSSVGLRPCVVYGPGRDQGLTSDTSVAMLAAAAGRPYHIGHGGESVFQYAPDVARLFLVAARAGVDGAHVHNMGGPRASVAEVVEAIEAAAPQVRGQITHADAPLPFPAGMDGSGLDALLGSVAYTPLHDGVSRTVELFRDRLASGLLEPVGG